MGQYSGIRHRILIVIISSLFIQIGHTKDTTSYQSIRIGPNIPPDVALIQENRQRDMDIFSWQSFVALNWPMNSDGNVDTNTVIGGNGDNETVWETWMSTADILDIPEGDVPVWGEHHVPQACEDNSDYKAGMKIIDQASKSDSFFQEAFDTGSLVDQSANFVRYEVIVNQDMFNTITSEKLYSASALKKRTEQVSFTCGSNETGEEGAIMIKAAWKVLTSDDDLARYHTDDAMVYVPAKYTSNKTDSCVKANIGLVGMHIVHKTVQQPQWVWSSFEHIDNVPDCDKQNTFFTDPSKLNIPTCPTQRDQQYSFYSDDNQSGTSCNAAPAPNAGDDYHLDKPGNKSQLCRANALETSAPPVNQAYQTLLKAINHESVWQHYQLIGTQWNSNIESSCQTDTTYVKKDTLPQYKIKDSSADIVPLPMGNITMEGYEQGTSNCLSCHASAKTTNLSDVNSDFVWFLSQEIDSK